MKAIRITKLITLAFLSLILLWSCEDDSEDRILVTIKANPVIADAVDSNILNGLQVELTDTRTMEVTKCILNASGTGTVELYRGAYNVSVESTIEGDTEETDCIYSAKLESVNVVASDQIVELDLNVYPAKFKGTNFIFSELFFNGETNSGKMMHPDRYYVIFNPTQETLYADGLCIATTVQNSIQNKFKFIENYEKEGLVPLTGFMTIPGTGTEYPVAPGDKFVIAINAIDHSAVAGYENAVDLSGADFEVYEQNFFAERGTDVDNPEVPNVLVTESFKSHPRGFWSTLLFKLENGEDNTIKEYYNVNKGVYNDPNMDNAEDILIFLDKTKIIDGVVTGDRPMITRPLPESVDRGYFQVSGCHRQELAIRKEIKIGNQIFYKDTNNSDEDFVLQKGQNSYPKGWRNNK